LLAFVGDFLATSFARIAMGKTDALAHTRNASITSPLWR
jgi:hypothetical protein